jgi:RNA polymerase sigma-70 factor (ECF subfamily)
LTEALEQAVRQGGARIVAVLAARFRNLDLAEEAFSEACVRAAESWPGDGAPHDPVAWLYRVSYRCGLDSLRRGKVRERLRLEPPPAEPTIEDVMVDDSRRIPDERLRLIFVCCHPAVASDSRVALTLRLVCGLSTLEIARAFLVPEPTIAQRLVRAKRKIADAGVPFEIPGPDAWPQRLDAVLSTLEVAYAKAHEDAAGAGPHAGYAEEMLELTRVLAELLPRESEVLALAATVRYAEARRPARLDDEGAMTPIGEQDPALWRRPMIAEGEAYLRRAAGLHPSGPRALQAAIHSAWCARTTFGKPAPWPIVLRLYDALLTLRDDPVTRINRAVALAEVEGAAAALNELEALRAQSLEAFLPFHAVRADLLRRKGRDIEARAAYQRVLALDPPPAERLWINRQMSTLLD